MQAQLGCKGGRPFTNVRPSRAIAPMMPAVCPQTAAQQRLSGLGPVACKAQLQMREVGLISLIHSILAGCEPGGGEPRASW